MRDARQGAAVAACNAKRVTGGVTEFMAEKAFAKGVTPKAADASTPSGFGPTDLQAAYGLTSAAASQYVTSVGGTALTKATSTTRG